MAHVSRDPRFAVPESTDSPTHWQDPISRQLRDRLGDRPALMATTALELGRLQHCGLELTPESVDKLIDIAIHKAEVQAKVVQYEPKPRRSRWTDLVAGVEGPVVYYMRIGDRVKIGTSVSLEQRLMTINPEELMALERGGVSVEQARHREFKALRTHGEWFRLEGRLVTHIERLRKPH